MSYMPPAEAAPNRIAGAAWTNLAVELDRWRAAGRVATLWWRDDDAVAATPALDRLLAAATGIPIGLAVIPARAERGLAERLARDPLAFVLQHGWSHADHAAPVGKKSEYPADRCADQVAAEWAAGRDRLVSLFGERALPAFVPPWNRVAAEWLPHLPGAGFPVLSGMASARPRPAVPGLTRLDVHVDLVAWNENRAFIGEEAALGALTGHLGARRTGTSETDIPTGIMSHHLVTGPAGFAFLTRLAEAVAGHPAARWLSPAEWLGAR